MKKKLFCSISVLVLLVCNLSAQKSKVEQQMTRAEKDSTNIERFIGRCQLYSTEIFMETPRNFCGFGGEAIVIVNLLNNEKFGCIKLRDSEVEELSFGYLDFDEIDNLKAALQKILDEETVKHYGKDYKIYYRSRGNFEMVYEDRDLRFSKVHYYINMSGAVEWWRVKGEESCDFSEIPNMIDWLEKAKEKLSAEITNINE